MIVRFMAPDVVDLASNCNVASAMRHGFFISAAPGEPSVERLCCASSFKMKGLSGYTVRRGSLDTNSASL
ncbi:MAG: hypothetical protein D6824_09745 [Planctomycetota bacterium]|nr:MAG: hypothetical protein D6824_09745 [Planctomycetota bacterium]